MGRNFFPAGNAYTRIQHRSPVAGVTKRNRFVPHHAVHHLKQNENEVAVVPVLEIAGALAYLAGGPTLFPLPTGIADVQVLASYNLHLRCSWHSGTAIWLHRADHSNTINDEQHDNDCCLLLSACCLDHAGSIKHVTPYRGEAH